MIYGSLDKITCEVCRRVITDLNPDEYTVDEYVKNYQGYNSLEEYQEDRYSRDDKLDELAKNGGKFYIITIDQNDETLYGVLGDILKSYNIDYEGDY